MFVKIDKLLYPELLQIHRVGERRRLWLCLRGIVGEQQTLKHRQSSQSVLSSCAREPDLSSCPREVTAEGTGFSPMLRRVGGGGLPQQLAALQLWLCLSNICLEQLLRAGWRCQLCKVVGLLRCPKRNGGSVRCPLAHQARVLPRQGESSCLFPKCVVGEVPPVNVKCYHFLVRKQRAKEVANV